MERKFIVIGGNHHNTLGVIRALGQKKINPFVIIVSKTSKSFVLTSKYVHWGIILSSSENAVLFARDRLYNDNNKNVIFSCSDDVTCALDRHYNELKDGFIFFNAGEQGRLCNLTNKYEMQHLAVASGLSIPLTMRIKGVSVPEGVKFPCLTKDVDNVNGSKQDMHVFKSIEELSSFLKRRKSKCDILVQQYVDKQMEFQLIGCSVKDTNGKFDIFIPGFTKILRAQPVTNTGFLEYYPINELKYNNEACRCFIENCGYTGLFSLEFLRGKDGIDYFLEINFRNDGNAYVVTKAGVNLPFIYVLRALDEDYSREAKLPIRKQISMPVIKDFKTVLQHRITLWKWLKDFYSTNCFFYMDKKDPKPLLAYIMEIIKSLL